MTKKGKGREKNFKKKKSRKNKEKKKDNKEFAADL